MLGGEFSVQEFLWVLIFASIQTSLELITPILIISVTQNPKYLIGGFAQFSSSITSFAHVILRASSPIWVSETGLARTRERAEKPRGAPRVRVLARLASLAQIGELARRISELAGFQYSTNQTFFAGELAGYDVSLFQLSIHFSLPSIVTGERKNSQ